MTKMPIPLPIRPAEAHKGQMGRVVVVAGSPGMIGAAAMTGQAALRGGAGLVTIACPEGERASLATKVTACMTLGLPCDRTGAISPAALFDLLKRQEKASAVAIGPGLGRRPGTTWVVRELVRRDRGPLVLDADGLNALAEAPDVLADVKTTPILTPHPGELSRLLGCETRDILGDPEAHLRQVVERWPVVCLLKGPTTRIVAADGRMEAQETGNCGMATGGSGDVLTGIVVALRARGLGAFDAARLGDWIHGLAGDLAAERVGTEGMIATDLIDTLPQAMARAAQAQ